MIGDAQDFFRFEINFTVSIFFGGGGRGAHFSSPGILGAYKLPVGRVYYFAQLKVVKIAFWRDDFMQAISTTVTHTFTINFIPAHINTQKIYLELKLLQHYYKCDINYVILQAAFSNHFDICHFRASLCMCCH